MRFFKHELDSNEIEQKIEKTEEKSRLASAEAELAQKEAVVKELKQKYGKNWAKTLGVDKLTDLASLRSFLKGANQGLRHQSSDTNTQTELRELSKISVRKMR